MHRCLSWFSTGSKFVATNNSRRLISRCTRNQAEKAHGRPARRPPAAAGQNVALFSFISLPWTVHALSWGKSKKKPEDPNSMMAKLVNKTDVLLIKDLQDADSVYVNNQGPTPTHQQIYDKLSRHRGKKEAELFWRLARVTYELSKSAENAEVKARLIQEAFADVKTALELDENNFAAHKWMAIILNARSTMQGVKEQITQSYKVREHMEKAAQLNPKDPTSTYLIGNWCFTVADIPWYQKKVAETIFAKPPSCSFDEAIQYFLRAENLQPLFYSMNLLMLAKTYMKLGKPDQAEQYLIQLQKITLTTDEDFQAQKEGNELLQKIQKSKKPEPKETPAATK